MKFFFAFTVIMAVASAKVINRSSFGFAQLEAIIAAINSPSTDPATGGLLQQQLLELLGISQPEPIIIEPAVVEPVSVVEGISPIAGPEIIDFPLHDCGALTAEVEPAVVAPSPAVVAPVESAPLVQIIVNVNGAAAGSNPVAVVAPEAKPEPVIVVEEAAPVVPEPVLVEETAPIVPAPIVLPEPVLPVIVEPENVVEPEVISVAEPVFPEVMPELAVNLPETLN